MDVHSHLPRNLFLRIALSQKLVCFLSEHKTLFSGSLLPFLLPLGWRVVSVTGLGLLLFSIAVLIFDPAQWRFALTEICAGLVLLRIVPDYFENQTRCRHLRAGCACPQAVKVVPVARAMM